MSLQAFQQALCDLVADPDLCVLARHEPGAVFSAYDLTDREHRRLVDAAAQPGMSVNCTLYRINRITPLYTLMPMTSLVLGDRLLSEAVEFWNQSTTDLQFGPEIKRFAAYLEARVAGGALVSPCLLDVVALELASNALQTLPRRLILSALSEATDGPLAVHPLVRVIRFAHDVVALLADLSERRAPGRSVAEVESYLLVDYRREAPDLVPLEVDLGRALYTAATDGPNRLAAEQVDVLRRLGLLVACPAIVGRLVGVPQEPRSSNPWSAAGDAIDTEREAEDARVR